MKVIKNLFRLLIELSNGRWAIVVISAVFPIIIMMGFGVFLAMKYGYLLEMSIAITVSSVVVSVPLYLQGKMKKTSSLQSHDAQTKEIKDDLVKASSYWSQNELKIWNESKHLVRLQLENDVEWGSLDKIALQVLENIAQKYNKEALDFSIPEGLKLFEEICRRYKLVIKEHIPGVEYLKISYIKAGYDAYEKYGELGQKLLTVAVWVNRARQAVYNPMKVAIDVANEQAGNSMTKGFVDDIQQKSKQAFLDEVSAVAIDLYSGRFSFEESEITASKVLKVDQERMAAELEPIRIVLVGQTRSGKSSIINVLKDEFVAEVDVLPSTDSTTAYDALIDENDVRVIDLKGLDGEKKTEELMLKEMIQADIVVWVLKANQSARALDKQLKDKFDQYYVDPKNLSRKKPKVISVVNQVDRLKPINEWQPPYDLADSSNSKANIISKAIDYNNIQLHPDVILPLAIALGKEHFGVDILKQTLADSIVDANNVQRNRQRIEVMGRDFSFKDQLNRVYHSGKEVAPGVVKVAAPHLAEMAVKKIIK